MRRVITGLDAQGRSCVLADEQAPDHYGMGDEVWHSDPRERPPWVARIAAADVPPIEPPRGGSWCRRLRFPPWEQYVRQLATRNLPGFDARGFHVTPTLDYIHVLSGDIWLDLEAGSVLLHPGDCVVQQATRHAWRTEAGADLLAVMIDWRN